MKRAYLVLLAIGLASCTGGGPGGNSDPSNKLTNTKLGLKNLQDGFFSLRMGSGFDSSSKTGTSGQSCLVGALNINNIVINNPAAVISFGQQQSLATLENVLDVDVSTKYGGGRFTFDAAAKFASDSKDDPYTENIVYLYKYAAKANFAPGTLGGGDNALTDVAKSFVHTDQIKFRQMCGNSYVEQMDVGVLLGVRLKLSFNSHSDQQKFNLKFSLETGLVDVATSIQQAAKSSNVNVKFSLSAIQLGGEPQRLNDIFGEKSTSGDYPFINCGSVGGTDDSACRKMTDAIISYAQTLAKQVSLSDGSLNKNNLYYSNPITSNYSTLGVVVGAKDPSPAVLNTMEQITKNYDETLYNFNFISHYLSVLKDKLDTPTQVSLRDATARLKNQIDNVYNSPVYGVLNCYKGYVSDSCLDIKRNVDEALKGYELTNTEKAYIEYIRHQSYHANLYSFLSGNKADPNNYYQVEDCLLVPISSPTISKYAAGCDGVWYSVKNLMITSNPIKKVVNISGLTYGININSDNIIMSYQDSDLNQDSFDPNMFYANHVNFIGNMGKSDVVTLDTTLTLTLMPDNDL